MRPRTACSACRTRQRRCAVVDKSQNVACAFCVRNELECSFAAPSPSVPFASNTSTHTVSQVSRSPSSAMQPVVYEHDNESAQASSIKLPPMDVCIGIATAYFIYIHDPTHNVFHRPSFMSDLTSGRLSQSIVLCVVALAARFSNHAIFDGVSPRFRGNPYARMAEKHLDLHDISLTTLQTVLLLGAFYGTEGDSMHETLYYTLACRIGCLLNVPDHLADSPLNRETSIRLWWTLDMIDAWSSNSTRLPRLLLPREDVPYPVSEADFLRIRRGHTFQQVPAALIQEEDSVLIQKIKLNVLLPEIAHLNRLAAQGDLVGDQKQEATDDLARRLYAWHEELPDLLRNTPENLTMQAASGGGGAFVALHIGFYHFSQLLYYQYLHQSLTFDFATSPRFSETKDYAERCRDSSTKLCELLYAAQALPGAEVYYSMVGHALVISSTVQMHILLFTHDEAEITAARHRLERNFVILTGLQRFWRTIDYSIGRLREFHAACTRAKAHCEDPSSTFRLDKWMLRFLMEFSKPIEERTDSEIYSPSQLITEVQRYGLDDSPGHIQQDLYRWSMEHLGIDLAQESQDYIWNPITTLESQRSSNMENWW